MEDTEKWVQCSQCKKWRCISDNIKLPFPWLCKYNVFDSNHNQCSHVQENMPLPVPSGTSNVSSDDEDTTIEVVPEDQVGMFTPSACACATCNDINTAVCTWKNMEEHPVPLINTLLRAITNTEPMAHAVEEDKQFIHGVSIDLHNPKGPST